VDGELGRIIQGPAVTTWPKLQPASVVSPEGAHANWDSILPNQRFVPQSPPDPVDPVVPDDCLVDCGDECTGCDCGCHLLKPADDVEAAMTDDETDGTEPTGAVGGEAATTEAGAPGGHLPLYGRSEKELSAMDQVGVLLAGRRGALETRVKQIQNSPEMRRFVVAALRAEQARIAGRTGPDERGQ
jgi:hypothetical protein